MRRTRKWAFVAQEATRLADLGLSPADIAKRLEVNKSTVTRWMSTGRLRNTAARPHRPARRASVGAKAKKTPGEWARSVRKEYDLDATDDQLVALAQAALVTAMDATVPAQIRMTASGRYQSIVRQLSLVARSADEVPAPKPSSEPKKDAARPAFKRTGTDPRKLLMVVPSP